ncbi:hypothetical protein POTOM_045068 [Populus tomentosa]|uniref:Shikimate dehydrogenase n=1 Tax=Populus tomentosa TaxID=118781 RepID=A0A8X7YI95_POPTO|nr:hypothetical protein POTOM_045068 [Populus tomentosa]
MGGVFHSGTKSNTQRWDMLEFVSGGPRWEGGQYEGDEHTRLEALRLAHELGADYIDVELKVDYEVLLRIEVAADLVREVKNKHQTGGKVIVSSYLSGATPSKEDLGHLVASMQATKADIIKVVSNANDITELERIFHLLSHSEDSLYQTFWHDTIRTFCKVQVPAVAYSLGERGLISQLLCPKFGGAFVYGAMEGNSIPGLPTLDSLRETYKVENINSDTKVFGLVSKPVSHSKGPILHNPAFRHANFNGIYVPMFVDDLKEFFEVYASPDFAGYSVGFPYKEAVVQFCDEVHPLAKSIGAVNTIIRKPGDGKLIGYNTDCEGSIASIEDALKDQRYINGASLNSPLAGKQFVVVGAGGAGRAIAVGAKSRGASVIIFDIDLERAKSLAQVVSGEAQHFDSLAHFQPEKGAILANATPIGMHPSTDRIPVAEATLGNYQLVFDAVYTPRKTRLLEDADAAGAITVSGVEMFLKQAIGQFSLFTGREAKFLQSQFAEALNVHHRFKARRKRRRSSCGRLELLERKGKEKKRSFLELTSMDIQRADGVRRNSTLICAPIMAESVDQMLVQMKRAKELGADLAEVRVDFLRNFSPRNDLEALIKQCPLPTLITYRPKWEGGQYDGDENKRQKALQIAMELGADFIDIELKVAQEFYNFIQGKKPEKVKIIVSSHNYECTPSMEEIGDLVARIQATGADIVKVATTALDITDNARMFHIIVNLQVPMIGLVMGERGLMSRVLAAKYGGFLTFGSVEAGVVSAPGQPTVKDLLELYNLRQIEADTKVHGVIGNPIGHSKSPHLYNAAFKSVGFNGIYLPLLVDSVANYISTYSSPDFAGYSYTIPHKEDGLKCCDEVDPIAKEIGAISCMIRRPDDGKLKGYNVDYLGAIAAIEVALGASNGAPASVSPLAGKLFVVMGAGGAGKALAYGAYEKGARVVVANRTYGKAEELASKVGGQAITLANLKDFHPEEGMILANTTSVGMKPRIEETPLAKEALKHYALVFDAIYTPKLTTLLREAQEAGSTIVYGTEMLINQAFVQFERFTGLPAPKQLIRDVLARNT